MVDPCQCNGSQIGTGLLKIGSVVPNATASTAYVGTRKSSTSQAAPGNANAGHNQRRVTSLTRASAALELRPRVLPQALPLRRQREQRDPVREVGLADDRR